MVELQTVETLNCLIERTETPPFYRLTSMRKASSHSADGKFIKLLISLDFIVHGTCMGRGVAVACGVFYIIILKSKSIVSHYFDSLGKNNNCGIVLTVDWQLHIIRKIF